MGRLFCGLCCWHHFILIPAFRCSLPNFISRQIIMQSLRLSVVLHRTIRRTSFTYLFGRSVHLLTSVHFMRDVRLAIKCIRRLLTTNVLNFQISSIISLRYLHAQPFQVTRRIRLTSIRTFSGNTNLLRANVHFAPHASSRVSTSGNIQRSLFSLFSLVPRRSHIMATTRRFRRLITSTLWQGVGVEDRASTTYRRVSHLIHSRIQFSKKSAMTCSPFRLIRNTSRISGHLPNTLPRITSISTYRRSLFSPI